MTTTELIERYGIKDGAQYGKPGAIRIMKDKLCMMEKALPEIQAHKAEILAYLAAEREAKERAEAEREAKIKAIEGLKEIQDAIEDMNNWREEFSASFEGEGAVGGLGVRAKPEYDIDGMMQRYPQAAAYIKAKKYAVKSNYELSAIGDKALEGVINGDWKAAIDTMEAELKEYTDRHLWD